ncbi:type II toxin-antitoxin system VapC family toxin [Parafilimonas sp.]|uniref:type II toxin-antitoxin system VapC family toxin n=1 Tax=Parafilimonas sp. TaxID=1969739 RepID=UPI0039E4D90A
MSTSFCTYLCLQNKSGHQFRADGILFPICTKPPAEIAIKLKTGKLKLSQSLNNYFQSALSYDISVLPINEKYLSEYDNVPLLPMHKDPFDRLIIATAIVEKMEIVTIDEKFSNYKRTCFGSLAG